MKIYVASSWRNSFQPQVVATLKAHGHEVYDFRNPTEGNKGFHWSEIDPEWKSWSVEEYVEALDHPVAEAGFKMDYDALNWCEACVGVMPFGRSASLELGYACGAGKLTAIVLHDGEPELMVKMVDHLIPGIDALSGYAIAWADPHGEDEC
jgi:hypothetical protein